MSHIVKVVQEPVQECTPPPLPTDDVLSSGAVLFPGVFDQHGCPLIIFPVDGQAKLSELSKPEIVDFINYFKFLQNQNEEKQILVSAVADLRHASLPTTRFIAETLLLLELYKQTVHSVYIIKPKKKDVLKQLLRLLDPSRSHTASFSKILLNEIPELFNYIDQSQLPLSLGGYHRYCHQSWVGFIKEINAFVQEFLSVVECLPSCISMLEALSRLPLPSSVSELQHFCSTNEEKFLKLRRELGLDELLRHCDNVVEKLCYPDREPCYQAMAGTSLFTHTAFDMLQKHSRITAAMEKMELMWQQAFFKAHLQLQVLQLRNSALQITEEIETLQEKLQWYRIEIAKDSAKAVTLVSDFEASIHTPAMLLVRCGEDVIHTLAEILPLEAQTREDWALDLERCKESLHSAVHSILQTLRAVSHYHHYYNKAHSWYRVVLCENFLQELLSGAQRDTRQQTNNWGMIPVWRWKLSTFLQKNPPPHMEELLHLAHLSRAITDDELQQMGKQISQRCMALRKVLMSSGPVSAEQLQLSLQWQNEYLKNNHLNQSSQSAVNETVKEVTHSHSELNHTKCECRREAAHLLATPHLTWTIPEIECKPPSLNSFDSGFTATRSTQLEASGGRDGVEGPSRIIRNKNSMRHTLRHLQIHNISCISDCKDHKKVCDLESAGNSSRASIQIMPRVEVDSLSLEITVKRLASLPSNPWLSLPLDHLEDLYTVTITQNSLPEKRDIVFPDASEPHAAVNQSYRCQDQHTQTDILSGIEPRSTQSMDWTLNSQRGFGDPELSPICNILSSTITDGMDDKSICTTEGVPTLLWDSYDLHDEKPDAVVGLMAVSPKDWDVKEQEGLWEVEKILGRADEILAEEENVLVQEAVVNDLLRSEDRRDIWPLWGSEDHLAVMSSSELADAGVLGLEESPTPGNSDCLCKLGSAESAGENTACADEPDTKTAMGTHDGSLPNSPDLLTELRNVHILDQLITEENLKIHKLRDCKENHSNELSGSTPLYEQRLSAVKEEREAYWLLFKKEKREVEKHEKSLNRALYLKKNRHEGRGVTGSSIIGNLEDPSSCKKLLPDSCKRSKIRHLTLLVQNNSQAQDTVCQTENFQALSSFEFAKEHLPFLQSKDANETKNGTSDVKELSEMVIQPKQCINVKELNGCGDKANAYIEVASLTSDLRPDEAFDPGVKPSCSPVLKPSKSLHPGNSSLAEVETSHSTEVWDQGPSFVAQDPCYVLLDSLEKALFAPPENINPDHSDCIVSDQNVKHSNNNNDNHVLPKKWNASFKNLSEITCKDGDDTSVESTCSLQVNVQPTEEIPQLLPQIHPDQPLEFDPGGDELNKDLRDRILNYEAMRISHSGSQGMRTQLDGSIGEVPDFKTPIVLDTMGLMKAGFADQERPNAIFPTIIGIPKYEEMIHGYLVKETYIGHDAQHIRGVLALKHPTRNGIIRNWDGMEKIWYRTFQQLSVDPEDHPVLLTEAAMNPLENQQRMVEIMFECFNVPFTYVAMQAVLALYAAGRTTGVVFDSGDGMSHSVPVFEGYCLTHAVQRFPLAGVDVTMYLQKLLQEQGVFMRTTAEEEIVREMERCCCIALNNEANLRQGGSSCREIHYNMPDGQIVTLLTERAPENLFKPQLIGRDHYGMHESIFKSILSSDIDLRRCFFENIVLSGGNTLLPGLPERLQDEIERLVPADMG
ncbi:uncharacterized protein PAE49_001830 isoform 2-T2 [Odontesthes bonariensis]